MHSEEPTIAEIRAYRAKRYGLTPEGGQTEAGGKQALADWAAYCERSKPRMIYIAGGGKWVTIRQYVAAIKKVKTLPLDTMFPYGLTSWWPTTGAEVLRQFMAGVHARINDGIPYSQRGL